jgi:surface-anchored protein
MKAALLVLILALAPPFARASMFLLEEGHCHYNIDFVNGQWQTSFRHDTDGVWPLDRIINHARTTDWPNGSRFIRPDGAQWDFTGVAAGEPLYIFPQANPGNVLWPSFSSDQTSPSAFAAYSESDPRVTSTSTRWVSYHLVQVRYWGDGAGHLAIWNSTIATQIVWMSTVDGIDASDRFLLEVGGHVHMNWGFSDIGWYEVDARASAYTTYPTVHTTSPPARIYFGIGVTGAPPAELSMIETGGTPRLVISAPGPGTNFLMTAEDLASETWTPVAFTNESVWTHALTNPAPRAFFRLQR